MRTKQVHKPLLQGENLPLEGEEQCRGDAVS